MSTTPTDTVGKKDTQKLQRAIVDGLEDVKAQDIQVFDTERLSPLFERVIVASGTSNRQTKALAASVRDAVREAGFPKPRIEGEENGEWIIVDCGAAVAHIMQPAIRQYYHLEEIWGEKPVRLKFGATKPAEAGADAKPPARKSTTKTALDGTVMLRKSSAVKTAERDAKAEKDAANPPAAKRTRSAPAGGKKVARAPARPASRAPAKAASAAPASPPAKKASAKTAAVKTPVKVIGKPVAKKAVAKSAPAKQVGVRKPAAKKAPGRGTSRG